MIIDFDKLVFCMNCEHFETVMLIEKDERTGMVKPKAETYCTLNMIYELTPERPVPMMYESTEKNKNNDCKDFEECERGVPVINTALFDQDKM